MSYYQGDYYRGDPGFFSFLKTIGSAAASFIPGVGSFASKLISKIPTGVRTGTKAAIGEIVAHPVLTAAGGAAAVGAGVGLMGGKHRGSSMTPAAMGGMHGAMRAAGGMGGGRHRRMHVTNVKALRRSLRRIKGFEKVARHVLHFTKPGHATGHAKFKFTRKKRW
jgi:hypothetical protein